MPLQDVEDGSETKEYLSYTGVYLLPKTRCSHASFSSLKTVYRSDALAYLPEVVPDGVANFPDEPIQFSQVQVG